MVSSLAENESSPARPEQNMLPHTFLAGLERRGEEGVGVVRGRQRRRGEDRRQVYGWQGKRKE